MLVMLVINAMILAVYGFDLYSKYSRGDYFNAVWVAGAIGAVLMATFLPLVYHFTHVPSWIITK